ncbi:DUF2651 family protein [Clostridium estertheticum]|uniref:DUF2651 family protein n=1 Tax=Clostridium estertheticum TaxID=238834 RepID=A0AA47EID2_9CLOT|nr:DUF2651 family protein [Clostridium estertheticum]MBU3155435.1 DUF2651 family protein [Clostridium estertheticum]MBU3199519.1 DUF2651 family protein [Clostridium estertheticum]WAG60506.1 DUF2651 family protein [Clostridium estertheticum]WAG65403.1 DUF2651 family protein [Clostridium estertheticum]
MKNKKIINVILGLLIILFSGLLIVFIMIKSSSEFDAAIIGMVLFGYPVFTLITSIVLQLLIKKKVIVLSIIFVCYLIPILIFNSSCLPYCFIYTLIGLIGTFIADFILKRRKRIIT